MSVRRNAGKNLMVRALDIDNLYRAWEDVKGNQGSPGGDLISLARFSRYLELNLLHLAERVRTGNYQPGKVRLVTMQTGKKIRQIAVWCVADRIIQRAVLNVIEPLFERIFLPVSFGYRPGRSVAGAVARILRLRNEGHVWMVDADIRDCFPSLDHRLLLSLVRKKVFDQDILDLIATWLPYGRSRIVRRSHKLQGISLGAVISPLLCNIYLHQLDTGLKKKRWNSVRYADDFVILCRSKEELITALNDTHQIVADILLEMNRKKTKLTSFDEGYTFLGVSFKGNTYSYDWYGKSVTATDMAEDFPLEVDGYR